MRPIGEHESKPCSPFYLRTLAVFADKRCHIPPLVMPQLPLNPLLFCRRVVGKKETSKNLDRNASPVEKRWDEGCACLRGHRNDFFFTIKADCLLDCYHRRRNSYTLRLQQKFSDGVCCHPPRSTSASWSNPTHKVSMISTCQG